MDIARRDIVDGLGKGLQIIEAFDEDHPRLTPTDAARRTGLSRTAARRYLLSLVHFGYAGTDGRHFWLAPRVLRLGQSYLEAARLPRLVQPFVQRVANACDATINFSVLDGHEVVYVARSHSPHKVSIGFPVGARVPAHVVTPGVAMLATWSEEALVAWVAAHGFSAFTPRTTTDPEHFLRDVRAARALGHWVTEQQLSPGLRGIAVPVRDRKGVCVGALGSTLTVQGQSREALVASMLPPLEEAVQWLRGVL